MDFALLVRQHVGLTLEKLGAFEAVILPQTGQIFYGLRILELCEVLLVPQVGVDLVEIARMAARLLLGILSSDGRHYGAWVSVQTVFSGSAAVGCCRDGWRFGNGSLARAAPTQTCRR